MDKERNDKSIYHLRILESTPMILPHENENILQNKKLKANSNIYSQHGDPLFLGGKRVHESS